MDALIGILALIVVLFGSLIAVTAVVLAVMTMLYIDSDGIPKKYRERK